MAVYRALDGAHKVTAVERQRLRRFDLAPHGKYQAAHDALGSDRAVVPAPQVNDYGEVDKGQQPQHTSIYRVHINN
jgi:hypothetical protein